MDYLEIKNCDHKVSDKNKYTTDESEFEYIKMMKENVIQSIKHKKANNFPRKKNKSKVFHNQYLNLLGFDKKDDSCFDDDLFFLKQENGNEKINNKFNRLEERKKYRLEKRKAKKIVHKKQLLIKQKKNPFIISIDEFFETE